MFNSYYDKKDSGIVSCIVFLLLGLALIIWPEVAKDSITKILGITILALGLISLITSLVRPKNPEKTEAHSGLLASNGLVAIIFGLILIFMGDIFFRFLAYLFGAVLIYSGVVSLVSLIVSVGKIRVNAIHYIVPILSIIVGLVFFFLPNDLATWMFILFGAVLVLNSVSKLISIFAIKKEFNEKYRGAVVEDAKVIEETAGEENTSEEK
ncbi:MAG: DUF308 domain-containing protein [Bacteroidales bacterium]|nr:DUF308 domain-containing protein [Bacteroidales bacterium]